MAPWAAPTGSTSKTRVVTLIDSNLSFLMPKLFRVAHVETITSRLNTSVAAPTDLSPFAR